MKEKLTPYEKAIFSYVLKSAKSGIPKRVKKFEKAMVLSLEQQQDLLKHTSLAPVERVLLVRSKLDKFVYRKNPRRRCTPKIAKTTLQDMCGDCKDFAVLVAAMLETLALRPIFIFYSFRTIAHVTCKEAITNIELDVPHQEDVYLKETNAWFSAYHIPGPSSNRIVRYAALKGVI